MPRIHHSIPHRLFISNWKNKGTSLVFAILIWAFAFENTEENLVLDAIVSISSADPTQAVLSETLPDSGGEPFSRIVKLELKGSRNLLEQIENLNPPLSGRFSVREGLVSLDIESAYENLPPAVTIIGATPLVVEVDLDPVTRRFVDVTYETIGNQTPRFRSPNLNDIKVMPAQVEIEGPSSLLADVGVVTSRIDIEGLDQAQSEQTVTLSLTNANHPAIRLADGSPTRATVQVQLASALETGKFLVRLRYGFPFDQSQPPLQIRGADRQVELTCEGTPEALGQLEDLVANGSFEVWIPLSDFSGTVKLVESSDFRWAEGSLPPQIVRGSMDFKPRQVTYRADLTETDGGGE